MSCKSSTFLLSSLTAAIVTLTPSLVIAAENELETVYVSATRSETAQLPIATQITIITAEEIRLSGAKLLSEVLRAQASIQLTDSDGSGGRNVTASMRGLSGANNVLVLVDGRKLNNPSMAAPALNTVSLKDVERIEIVQGSAGVLYGDQAIGGVINIITRRAKAGEINGFVGATSGSFNLEDYAASVNQGFENGLSYSASAQKRNADNYRDNNQNSYENILGNVRYDFEKGFVFFEGQKVDDELRLPGDISDAQALINPRFSNSLNDFNNQYSEVLRSGVGVELSQCQILMDYVNRDEETEGFWFGDNASHIDQISFSPRVVGKWSINQGDIVATLGYDSVDVDYERQDILVGSMFITQKIEDFYGQVILPITRPLNITLGMRESDVEDFGKTINANVETQKRGDKSARSNEIGLNYDATESWRLFTRFAEGFRYANADEYTFALEGFEFIKPQTSQSSEIGVAWQSGVRSAQWSFYEMKLQDEIGYDAAANDGWGANVNFPDSEREGANIFAATELGGWLSLNTSLSYTDAKISHGVAAGKRVPFVAKNTGTLGLSMQLFEFVSVNFNTVYTGKRYRSGDDLNTAGLIDENITFDTALLFSYKDIDISGRIENITDEHYAGYQSYSVWSGNTQYPQPGRNYEASITYRF